MPPPPPPPTGGSTTRPSTIDGPRLKPLHWRKLPATSVTAGSVWARPPSDFSSNGEDLPLEILSHELGEIARLFPHKDPVRRLSTRGVSSGAEGGLGARAPPPEFLSAKRAQNIAISLTKVSIKSYESLANAVSSLNPTCELTRDDVTALELITPSDEEIRTAKAARAKLASLAEEHGDHAAATASAGMRAGEKFVLALLDVPHFGRKLQVILQLLLFPQHVSSVVASIATMHAAAVAVPRAPTLKTCLALCLRLGNVLNRGTPRGNAAAFDLAILPTLGSIKATGDTSYSLLHFVAAQLQRVVDAKAKERAADGLDDAAACDAADGVTADGAPSPAEEPTPAGLNQLLSRCADADAQQAEADGEAEGFAAIFGAAKENRGNGGMRGRSVSIASTESNESDTSSSGACGGGVSGVSGGGACGDEGAPDAVATLRQELLSLREAGDAMEIVGSIEASILKLRSELQYVRNELAQLPPKPPAPALLYGYPIVQTLDASRVLALFACDEVATVHWVLVPRWRKPPTMSFRGRAHSAPRPIDVLSGRGRDGAPAVASGAIVIGKPEYTHVLALEKLPKGAELAMYACVNDTFGWLSEAEIREGSAEGERGRALMASWHTEAFERMRAARPTAAAAKVRIEVGVRGGADDDGAESGAEGGGESSDFAPEGSRTSSPGGESAASDDVTDAIGSSTRSSSARGMSPTSTIPPAPAPIDTAGLVAVASTPPVFELSAPPTLFPEYASPEESRSWHERRAAHRVLTEPPLRASLLVRTGSDLRSISGVVRALTTRGETTARDVLSVPPARSETPPPLPLSSSFSSSFGTKDGKTPPPIEIDASILDAEALEASAYDAAHSARPRPCKVGVDGLHARFLLEAFLRDASAEIARVQTLHDELLAELAVSARFLGLDKGAQRSVSDQLGALSTLRDFSAALSRCAAEAAAKKADAEKRAKRPSIKRPSLVAVQAATRLTAGGGEAPTHGAIAETSSSKDGVAETSSSKDGVAETSSTKDGVAETAPARGLMTAREAWVQPISTASAAMEATSPDRSCTAAASAQSRSRRYSEGEDYF